MKYVYIVRYNIDILIICSIFKTMSTYAHYIALYTLERKSYGCLLNDKTDIEILFCIKIPNACPIGAIRSCKKCLTNNCITLEGMHHEINCGDCEMRKIRIKESFSIFKLKYLRLQTITDLFSSVKIILYESIELHKKYESDNENENENESDHDEEYTEFKNKKLTQFILNEYNKMELQLHYHNNIKEFELNVYNLPILEQNLNACTKCDE